VLVTYRVADVVRDFLADAQRGTWHGARACFLSGAFLGGAFAGGWRLDLGAVLDVGPHILDLVEDALCAVTEGRAAGEPGDWVAIRLLRASGARSEGTLSCASAIEPSR